MTISDLKRKIIRMLKEKYPPNRYQIYGVDTTEGYARPCFFVSLRPISMEAEGRNVYNNEITCYIDYIQETIDECDMLNKVEEIRSMFELYFNVGSRAVDTSNFDFDYIGSKKNILEISFDMQYHTAIEKESSEHKMTNIVINSKEET